MYFQRSADWFANSMGPTVCFTINKFYYKYKTNYETIRTATTINILTTLSYLSNQYVECS